MTSKTVASEIPTRYGNLCICGLAFVILMFANLLPASAAAIGVQPGMLKALGQPAATINSTHHLTFCSCVVEVEEPTVVVVEADEPTVAVVEADELTTKGEGINAATIAGRASIPAFTPTIPAITPTIMAIVLITGAVSTGTAVAFPHSLGQWQTSLPAASVVRSAP